MTQSPTQTPQSLAQAPCPYVDAERKRQMRDAWKIVSKVALQADLCYNKHINIVAPAVLATPRGWTNLVRRFVMDSLSPHAQEGNIPRKRCYDCKNFFPATSEFFHLNKAKNDGLNNRCKTCLRVAYRAKHPLKPKQEIEGQKQCSHCTVWKPATPDYFHRNKDSKDGWLPKCKDCCHEHYNRNRERNAVYRKEYYSRPGIRERHLANEKARRDNPETREDFLAKKRVSYYRSARQAHLKEYYSRPEVQEKKRQNDKKRYYDPVIGPHVREQKRARTLRRVAHKKSVSGTYTPEQIQDLLKRQKHKCYYCSTKFDKKGGRYVYHIDHTFPISRVAGSDIPANDISYLVLTCPTCNLKKGNKFPWEWIEGGRLL